jgi:hypothetical protein
VPLFNTVRQNTMQIWSEMAKTQMFPPLFVGKIMLDLSDLPNKAQYVGELEQLLQMQKQEEQAKAEAEAQLELATSGGAGASPTQALQ